MPVPLLNSIATLARSAVRAAIVATALLLSACSFAQELVVVAASSLTESFEGIAVALEARHEGVDVLLAFGGSSTLAMQILQGAPRTCSPALTRSR